MSTKSRKLLASFGLLAGLAAVAACGQLSSKGSLSDPETGLARNLGCIQGVAVNGLTGETVHLGGTALAKGEGVRVLVGDTTLAQTTAAAAVEEGRDMSGRYTICDIPLDERYPIVINLPGYQRLEGMVQISSTEASKSEKALADVAKLVPVSTVNLRLYPVGVQTTDFQFLVTKSGLPQKDATVILTSSGDNTLNLVDADLFLMPRNISAKPLTGKTDELGSVIFKAAELVLGAEMSYRVIPATTDVKETIATGTINIGLLSMTDVQHPYVKHVDLKNPLPRLDVVSSNMDDLDFVPNGELILYFNRDVEMVPGTEDNLVAALANANGATLVPDVPGNLKPDQVEISIVGNVVRMLPKYEVEPDQKTEGGLVVSYSGLAIRAKASPGTADARMYNDLAVEVFGGVTPPQVATALGVPADSGNGQTGPANGDLVEPVQVRVLDQFGKPYKQAFEVVFTVTSGNGDVRGFDRTRGAGGAERISVYTDGTGLAKALWRLGNVNGQQQLSISGIGVQTVVYAATATPVLTDLIVTRGGTGTLTGPASADLVEPIEVQVVDQNGEPYHAGLNVQFAVDPLVGGAVRKFGAAAPGSPTLDLATDASTGKAAVVWTLGSRNGAQALTIKSFSYTETLTATATPVASKLSQFSGNGLELGPRDGMNDVEMVVQLKDQQNGDLALAGKAVTFQVVTAGQGTLRTSGSAGPGTAVIFPTVTDATGKARAVFRLISGAVGAMYEVKATSEGLTQASFTGRVKAVAKTLDKTGDAQNGPLATDLSPYFVQMKDQDGNPLRQQGVSIVFAVFPTATAKGTVRKADGTSTAATSVEVLTDAEGKAGVIFRPTEGAAGTSWKVTATPNLAATGLGVVEFLGTVQ